MVLKYENICMSLHKIQLSRGEIFVANFRPPATFMTSNVVANLFQKYLGPNIVGLFGPICKIFQLFLTQNQNKKGVCFMKNCQLMYLGAHFGGRFEKWGSADQPIMDQLKNFQHFLTQNQN